MLKRARNYVRQWIGRDVDAATAPLEELFARAEREVLLSADATARQVTERPPLDVIEELEARPDGLPPAARDLLLGRAYHALGLWGRANQRLWAAQQAAPVRAVRRLLRRTLTDEHHPERLALVPVCQGRGIDVGCGARKTHPDAIGVDLLAGGTTGEHGVVAGAVSVADVCASGDDLHMFRDGELDYVVQRHNLEHYQDFILALQEWKRVVRPGGVLGMVVPDDEHCDTIHLDPTHKHVFTRRSFARVIDLLGGLEVIHSAEVLARWSFVAVVVKTDGASSGAPTFGYLEAVRRLEQRQAQEHADALERSGQADLARQARALADRLAVPTP